MPRRRGAPRVAGTSAPPRDPGAPALAWGVLWRSLGWLLLLTVVYLSMTPTPPDAGFSQSDKLGHLLAYASLMAWWSQLDHRHGRLALAFVLMGLALEVAQGLTDYRQSDVLDMAANSAGVALGWFFSRLWPGWLPAFERRFAT